MYCSGCIHFKMCIWNDEFTKVLSNKSVKRLLAAVSDQQSDRDLQTLKLSDSLAKVCNHHKPVQKWTDKACSTRTGLRGSK